MRKLATLFVFFFLPVGVFSPLPRPTHSPKPILREEQKRQILVRFDANLERVRDKWVGHWQKILDKLSEILARLEARMEKLAGEGKDVAAVRTAGRAARTAITDAKGKIGALLAKDYRVEVSGETGLGKDVRSLISQFKADMKAIQEAVKEARQAVRRAFEALKEAK